MYILYYILYLLLSYPLKNFLKTPFSFPKLIIPDFQQTKKNPQYFLYKIPLYLSTSIVGTLSIQKEVNTSLIPVLVPSQ